MSMNLLTNALPIWLDNTLVLLKTSVTGALVYFFLGLEGERNESTPRPIYKSSRRLVVSGLSS